MNSVSLPGKTAYGELPARNQAHERKWIAAAQRGDISAFNHLVRAYQDLAYHIAHYLLDDSDSAINATQNAFVAAQKSIQKCPRHSFRIWFFRVLLQECRQRERAAWSRPNHQTAQTSTLHIGLATIPFDDRAVCVLSDIIGLADREISLVTRSPEAGTREQRNRARRQLRDVIQLLWVNPD